MADGRTGAGAPVRSVRVVLFTKPAVPGQVKTRLAADGGEPSLSAGQAAQLHVAFREDVAAALREARELDPRIRFEVAWALERGSGPDADLGEDGWFEQSGSTLGTRLHRGLARDPGADVVMAVGSDHPELAPEVVVDAVRRIGDGADVVLGPAADGGYFLIALRRERLVADLFDGVPWSTADVLEQTLRRCRALGLAVETLAPGHDCDTPRDLAALVQRLATAGRGPDSTWETLASWRLLPMRTEERKA